MRHVSLDELGFVGYTLYEDGTLDCPGRKRITQPYGSGQITLRNKDGGIESRYLAKLVAYYFLEPVDGCFHLDFLDGVRSNCAASNLKWVAKRPRLTRNDMFLLRPQIIGMHVNGKTAREITLFHGVSLPTVHKVIRDFELSVEGASRETDS